MTTIPKFTFTYVNHKFKIYDWAGNDLTKYHGTFTTFDAAWDYILGDMTDQLGLKEEDYQEFEVRACTDEHLRPKRYLDPKDPRGET